MRVCATQERDHECLFFICLFSVSEAGSHFCRAPRFSPRFSWYWRLDAAAVLAGALALPGCFCGAKSCNEKAVVAVA